VQHRRRADRRYPGRQLCSQGLLDGYPNLSMESCEWAGRNAGREIWRCPAEIAGGYKSS
jgi:hypothetical protein